MYNESEGVRRNGNEYDLGDAARIINIRLKGFTGDFTVQMPTFIERLNMNSGCEFAHAHQVAIQSFFVVIRRNYDLTRISTAIRQKGISGRIQGGRRISCARHDAEQKPRKGYLFHG